MNYLEVCERVTGFAAGSAAEFSARLREVLEGRMTAVELEYPCDSPDEHRWFIARATRFAGQGAVRVVIAHENLTARKQAEERLKNSEDRWRHAVQGSAAGVWEVNYLTGECFYSNRSKEMLGYGPDDIPHDRETWTALIHPEDVPIGRLAMAEHLAGRKPFYEAEHRFRCKDGSYRWISSHAQAVFDASGRMIRISGTHVDIHERKLAEDRLRESEAYIKAVMDHLPLGVAVNSVDPTVKFEYMNDQFPALYRTTREALARPDSFWTKAYQDPAVREEMRRRILEDCASGDIERMRWEDVPISRRGEATTYVNAQNTPVPGRSLMISTVWDVTARKLAEEALRATVRDKEALLKEVHHRVKNNLQVITSLLRLEAGHIREPGTKVVLREMQDRIRSMALLHETLYRSGNYAAVNLSVYLRQLTNQLFRAHNTDPGRVHLVLDLAQVQVEMDQAIPCGLIVNELTINSLKHAFAAKGVGEVRISLSAEPGGELKLCISDNGAGLPADFDLAKTDSLGLRLVSDLTRQLQGRLIIGPGPGATFILIFNPVRSSSRSPFDPAVATLASQPGASLPPGVIQGDAARDRPTESPP
jgi:PAS domain S-box-containing protein